MPHACVHVARRMLHVARFAQGPAIRFSDGLVWAKRALDMRDPRHHLAAAASKAASLPVSAGFENYRDLSDEELLQVPAME
jgi:hypothetical protein